MRSIAKNRRIPVLNQLSLFLSCHQSQRSSRSSLDMSNDRMIDTLTSRNSAVVSNRLVIDQYRSFCKGAEEWLIKRRRSCCLVSWLMSDDWTWNNTSIVLVGLLFYDQRRDRSTEKMWMLEGGTTRERTKQWRIEFPPRRSLLFSTSRVSSCPNHSCSFSFSNWVSSNFYVFRKTRPENWSRVTTTTTTSGTCLSFHFDLLVDRFVTGVCLSTSIDIFMLTQFVD